MCCSSVSDLAGVRMLVMRLRLVDGSRVGGLGRGLVLAIVERLLKVG